MKPTIKVSHKSNIVEVTLKADMNVTEIDEFLLELEDVVDNFSKSSTSFSLLNRAEEKSFTDLAAVKELSIGMKRVLALGEILRVAIVRPQGDYQVDISQDRSDDMKVCSDIESAKRWLLE